MAGGASELSGCSFSSRCCSSCWELLEYKAQAGQGACVLRTGPHLREEEEDEEEEKEEEERMLQGLGISSEENVN